MRGPGLMLCAILLPGGAWGYSADLVPASNRPETAEIVGRVSIGGADGAIHVEVEGVQTPDGSDFLDTNKATVHLKVRVNGQRRSVTLPLVLDAGDGIVDSSLGLEADDRVIVNDVRVRGPTRRTLAQAGVITADVAAPTPTPEPPPPPNECPAALASCQSDLTDCETSLDECEFGF
jgi:hypothetical protein